MPSTKYTKFQMVKARGNNHFETSSALSFENESKLMMPHNFLRPPETLSSWNPPCALMVDETRFIFFAPRLRVWEKSCISTTYSIGLSCSRRVFSFCFGEFEIALWFTVLFEITPSDDDESLEVILLARKLVSCCEIFEGRVTLKSPFFKFALSFCMLFDWRVLKMLLAKSIVLRAFCDFTGGS